MKIRYIRASRRPRSSRMTEPTHRKYSSDEQRIMIATWRRMAEQLHTDGFREGALQGKDEQSKSSYDRGFKDGFQKGFESGLKLGEQKASEFHNKTHVQDEESHQKLYEELCSLCCKTTISNKPSTN